MQFLHTCTHTQLFSRELLSSLSHQTDIFHYRAAPESSLHLTAVAIPTATLRISTARDSASDSETDSASNAVEDETDAALVLVQLLRPQTSPNAQPCRLFTRPTTRSPSEAPAGRSANMERAKIETTMQDEDEERSAEENLLPFTLRLMPLRGIYTQVRQQIRTLSQVELSNTIASLTIIKS